MSINISTEASSVGVVPFIVSFLILLDRLHRHHVGRKCRRWILWDCEPGNRGSSPTHS